MERPAYCYRFGTAEFDEGRHELKVAGLPVEVERRALEVLAYLLAHAGEVVTKEELLREVWAGRITVDKVLPNAINKLRRALGEANAGHITTQARVGYRLDGVVSRVAVGRQLGSSLELTVGQPVPGRPNFLLRRLLGKTAGSEVWLAEHPKTREQRVYKFALEAERLRALKREVTLLRVLQEAIDDNHQFVEVVDWNFETAPYFLECKYGGDTLLDWAAEHLAGLDTPARIALFLQIARAVASAHAVGVLHKDLKPGNVLVAGGTLDPHVRLTDFGSGHLLAPDRLAQLGITRMGLTVEDAMDSTSGTPLYIAPELFAGQVPTVRSDVFALGILLYQLLTGRVGQPMASGWEAEVQDELLREDLRAATDGDPNRRLSSAAELVDRLQRLDERRSDRERHRQAQEAADRDRELLAREKARKPALWALFAVLVAGVLVALVLQQRALSASRQARIELERATALAQFLNEDLIGRSNPLVSTKGPDATLREVLVAARERVPVRFGAQPDTEALIHGNLATLFNTIDLFAEAEGEARKALDLAERQGTAGHVAALEARAVLIRVLSRMGRSDDARWHLDELDRLVADSPSPVARQRLEAARSTWLIGRGEFGKAAVALRASLAELERGAILETSQRDSLRLDLVASLALAGEGEQALAEGRQLIEEASARKDNSELLVAMTRVSMARVYRDDHAQAEKLLLEARPVIVAKLGENHSRYLHLLGELLSVAFRRADWPKAVEYAQEVHDRARAKFGERHTLVPVTLTNWARTLGEAGRPREAVDKARAAHERLLDLAGPKSPQTQDAAFVLAAVELQLAQAKSALALLSQIDAKVLEAGRSTGQWQIAIDALRGVALQQLGDSAAAKPLLDAGLANLESADEASRPGHVYAMVKRARARLH